MAFQPPSMLIDSHLRDPSEAAPAPSSSVPYASMRNSASMTSLSFLTVPHSHYASTSVSSCGTPQRSAVASRASHSPVNSEAEEEEEQGRRLKATMAPSNTTTFTIQIEGDRKKRIPRSTNVSCDMDSDPLPVVGEFVFPSSPRMGSVALADDDSEELLQHTHRSCTSTQSLPVPTASYTPSPIAHALPIIPCSPPSPLPPPSLPLPFTDSAPNQTEIAAPCSERADRKKRRLGFSVFVDPNDHPDHPNHMLRHLSLTAASVPNREKSLRLQSLLGSAHPLFKNLAPEICRRIFTEFIYETKSAASVLFNAGDMNDNFYLVAEGEIECVYQDGEVETVLVKRSGDTLGDISLMQPCPMPQPFTARCRSNASLYTIEGCIFRFLVQNGMQLRYQQLKSFFTSMPLFQNCEGAAFSSDLIENLIENAQILEFNEGEVIIPVPANTDDIVPPLHLQPSAEDLSWAGKPFSFALHSQQISASPSASTSTPSTPSASPIVTSINPTSSPSPAYLQNCVFIVKDGRVAIRRNPTCTPETNCNSSSSTVPTSVASSISSATSSLLASVTSPTNNNFSGNDVQILGNGDLFGLEILSCSHRLLDQSASTSSSVAGSVLMSPALSPFTTSAAASSSLPPFHHHHVVPPSPSTRSAKKRTRRDQVENDAASCTAEEEVASDNPPVLVLGHSPFQFPSSVAVSTTPSVSATPASTIPSSLAIRHGRHSSMGSGVVISIAALQTRTAPHSPSSHPVNAMMSDLQRKAYLYEPLVSPTTSAASTKPASLPIHPLSSCVSPPACACRGEVRCHSTAAIVLAIDARIWKNILLKSI